MHSVKSGRELGGLLLHIFLFDNIDELLAPMWFCTALFFASLIYYCIHRINLDKIINIIILLVLLIVAFLIKRKNFIICYSINFKSIISTVLAATFFYGIGNVCRDTKLMEKLLENNRSRLIYGMVMGGILGITYFDGVRGGMLDLSYNNPILFLIASLSGLILFWTLVFQLYKLNFLKQIFEKIGKISLHMMALQFISIKISIVIISILFKMSILESLKSYSIPSEFTVPDRMVGFLIAFFICACLSNVNYKLKMLLDSKIDLVLGEKVINSK